MDVQNNPQEQTFEQFAMMWSELAGWAAGFSNGVVTAFETGGESALGRLSAVRAQYQLAIAQAILRRDAAITAADVIAESVWRSAADEMSRIAFLLADETKDAATRLATFQMAVNDGLRAIGRYAGPAFDVYGVADAIRSGDGNKAGEAVLAMGLGVGFGAALVGLSNMFGLSAAWTAFMGGIGSVGGSVVAKYVNPYTARPVFDWMGTYLPDSWWKNLESATFGEGAARLDPSGSVYASMLLHRIDNAIDLTDLGGLFDVAGSAREGRETVALLNSLAQVFNPSVAELANNASDQDIVAFAGQIAAVTDRVLGGIQITMVIPTTTVARDDFGALLSLQLGLPFSIRLTDPSTTSPAALELYALHRTNYERWLADKNAIAQGADTAQLHFSDVYLQARIEYAQALALANTEEIALLGGIASVRVQGTSQNHWFEDRTSEQYVHALGNTPLAPARKVLFGTSTSDSDLEGGDKADRIFGLDGNDTIKGGGDADYLEGNAGNDLLEGGAGNDTLIGGAGIDIYQFAGSFGKDTVFDGDGLGTLQIDGHSLGQARGAGKANVWVAELGSGNSSFAILTLQDSTASRTGKVLVIAREGNTSDTITINHFDLTAAQAGGYLGIQLDSIQRVALVQGSGASAGASTTVNTWSDTRFEATRLNGKDSSLGEGHGKGFTVSLSRAALAGETLTLALSGALADQFKVSIDGSLVNANGAVIALTPGQTFVNFTLMGNADLSADLAGSLSVSYQGLTETTNSNSWGLTLADTSEAGAALTLVGGVRVNAGTYRHELPDGYETRPLPPGEGDILGGGNDGENSTIYDSATNTTYTSLNLSGLAGNDVLFGMGSSDKLDGGTGDDVIFGGLGSDQILGGDGNDVILANVNAWESGFNWTQDLLDFSNQPESVSSGISTFGLSQNSAGAYSGRIQAWDVRRDADGYLFLLNFLALRTGDAEDAGDGDTVDAGAGDDSVWGGLGEDLLKGGAGHDQLQGLGGSDVILGDDGNDEIYGDSNPKRVFMSMWDRELREYVLQAHPALSPISPAVHGDDYIDAGSGDDRVWGDGGDDLVLGGDGDDQIRGDNEVAALGAEFHGHDYLDGGQGNDSMIGGGGHDVLYGGIGNDHLWGDDQDLTLPGTSHGRDFLDGGDGDDYLEGGGGSDDLFGGDGNDRIRGDTSASFLSLEFHGDDRIDAGAGNDEVWGDGGNDFILGGDGDDQIRGDNDVASLDAAFHGDDHLEGGLGHDEVIGGGGNDVLYGGVGNDRLWGDDQDLALAGTAHGRDFLDGGDGDDYLEGGGGDDELFGGSGNDSLRGDTSTDFLSVEFHGDDYLDGGAGNDVLQGGGGSDTLKGGAGNDVLIGDLDDPEEVAGEDVLHGGDGDDELQGGAGNDSLFGEAGDDTLYGDSGDDILNGGAGTDFLFGGAGDDTYVFDSSAQASTSRIEDTEGVNRIFVSGKLSDIELRPAESWPGAPSDLAPGSLVMLMGNRTVYIDGGMNGAVQEIQTSSGERVTIREWVNRNLNTGVSLSTSPERDLTSMWGGRANDVLTAGVNGSEIWGGQGDDDIVLNSSGNTIHFQRGDGVDELQSQTSEGNIIVLGQGISMDDLQLEVGSNGEVRLNLGGGDAMLLPMTRSNITSSPFISHLRLSDGQVVGWWTLLNKGVLIQGSASDDVLEGTAGKDIITGGVGDDALVGHAGDDILEGGPGSNFLDGGEGDDTFRVKAGDSYTFILDDRGRNTLSLGAGLSAQALTVTQPASTQDLVLAFSSGETIHISGGMQRAIDLITFADGSTLTFPALLDKVNANALVLSGDDAANELVGAGGADTLTGNGGNDRLWGNGGSDELIGGVGNDLLVGGRQNDVLRGGEGDDAYRFALGDGQDVIEDVEGEMTLEFGAGIAATDLIATRETTNGVAWLRVAYGATDSVMIKEGDSIASLRVKLADGSVLSQQEMYAFALQESRTAVGTAGNDTLYGYAGGDTLNGGGGTDVLRGGRGQDVYQMSALGRSTVQDNDGGLNIIRTLAGSSSQLALQRLGADLLIDDATNQSKLLIEGFFNNQQAWSLQLSDDSVGDLRALVTAHLASDESLEERRDAFYQRVVGVAGANWQYASTDAGGNEYITSHTTVRDITTSNGALIEANSSRTESSSGEVIGSFQKAYSYIDYITQTTTLPGEIRLLGYVEGERFFSSTGQQVARVPSGPHMFTEVDGNGRTNLYAYEPGKTVVTATAQHVSGEYTEYVHRWIKDTTLIVQDVRGGDGDNSLVLQSYPYSRSPVSTMVSAGAGNDLIDRTQYRQEIFSIGWSPLGDFLDGGSGNDRIFAGVFGDEISGGTGSDYLSGSDGDDTYFVSSIEDGFDTIYDMDNALYHVYVNASSPQYADTYPGLLADAAAAQAARRDVVRFGSGIDRASITVEQVSINVQAYPDGHRIYDEEYQGSLNALQITWGTAGGIRVAFDATLANAIGFGIERFEFADGTFMTFAEMQARIGITPGIVGTVGNDNLVGTSGNDSLLGLAGNDTLLGNAGADTLDGGNGDDHLDGGAGGDVYLVNATDSGWDTVHDRAALADEADPLSPVLDTVRFGGGVTPQALQLAWTMVSTDDGQKQALAISWGGAGGVRVVVPPIGVSPGMGIERFEFADASVWTLQQMLDIAPPRPGDVHQLVGTEGNDTLSAGLLASSIQGLGGNDLLTGSSAADTIDGGSGNDTLVGGGGDDVLLGGDGDDELRYSGNAGAVSLIEGGAGNDVIEIGPLGRNTVVYRAGDGLDTIVVNDEDGDDTLRFADLELEDLLFVRQGDNLLIGLREDPQGSIVLLSNFFTATQPEEHRFSSYVFGALAVELTALDLIDRVQPLTEGTSLDDLLIGGVGNDLLHGGDGNDRLVGVDGDDVIWAGNGNDLLEGGAGSNTLVGGAGDDWYWDVKATDRIVEWADGGRDTVVVYGDGGSLSFASFGEHIEVVFADGFDSILGTERADEIGLFDDGVGTVVEGGLGDDTLTGGAADDVLLGGDGNDLIRGIGTLDGGTGNDVLRAEVSSGVSHTLMKGGAGDDNLYYSGNAGSTAQIEGGAGNDFVGIGPLGRNTFVYRAGDGIDTIYVNDLDGDDTLQFADIDVGDLAFVRYYNSLLIGHRDDPEESIVVLADFFTTNQPQDHRFANYVFGQQEVELTAQDVIDRLQIPTEGTALDDTLNGGAGDDILYGYDGNDSISGMGGNDSIVTGNGNDLLRGGLGDDTLVAGNGDDIIVFGRGDGADLVLGKSSSWLNDHDTVQFETGIDHDQLWFEQVGDDLRVSLIGTGDSITVADWYLVGSLEPDQYRLDEFKTQTGESLLKSQVDNLVSAMAAFSPPPMGQFTLDQTRANALGTVIAASWQ